MIASRLSDADHSNPQLKSIPRKGKGSAVESNRAWLRRALGRQDPAGAVLLLGGTSRDDFRLRVAQSHARMDMLPSCWSHAAIVEGPDGGAGGDDLVLREVRLDPPGGFGDVPGANGVQTGRLSRYDDPARFPNVACLRFPVEAEVLRDAVEGFRRQRTLVDVGGLIVDWLRYVWGVGDSGNPLLRGGGIPGAAFVEESFALAGLELTPGLSSRSSCPEAIWQSARWWHGYYESGAAGVSAPPSGAYCIDQPAAAATIAD